MSDVRTYTLGQLHGFSAAIERGRRRRLVDTAVTVRVAKYKAADYKKYLQALSDG